MMNQTKNGRYSGKNAILTGSRTLLSSGRTAYFYIILPNTVAISDLFTRRIAVGKAMSTVI